MRIDIEKLNSISTPANIICEEQLLRNIKTLNHLKDTASCEVYFSTKAFWVSSAMVMNYFKELSGISVSSLFEAKIAAEQGFSSIISYSPAYKMAEIEELKRVSNKIIFNSIQQFERFADICGDIEIGLRITPFFDAAFGDKMANPVTENTRFGVTSKELLAREDIISKLSGLMFHCHFRHGLEELRITLREVERNFGEILEQLKFLSFGGGIKICSSDFDVNLLAEEIIQFQRRYGIKVILEPGETVLENVGLMLAEVLSVHNTNGYNHAILDLSAYTHMPDVLSFGQTPDILNGQIGENGKHVYILGANSCLSADVFGTYSFEFPLKVHDRICFLNQAAYTITGGSSWFNGLCKPDIWLHKIDGTNQLIKKYTYSDFTSQF